MSSPSEFVIYRCTECGKTSVSVGWLHAHIDAKHHGFGPFNIIPNPRRFASFQKSMEKTEVLRATGVEEIGIEEVGDDG